MTSNKSDTWKMHLKIKINFISSKDHNDEELVMHSKRDNTEIMISDLTEEIIEELFNPLENRYQNNLQAKRGSGFVFDYVRYCITNITK